MYRAGLPVRRISFPRLQFVPVRFSTNWSLTHPCPSLEAPGLYTLLKMGQNRRRGQLDKYRQICASREDTALGRMGEFWVPRYLDTDASYRLEASHKLIGRFAWRLSWLRVLLSLAPIN